MRVATAGTGLRAAHILTLMRQEMPEMQVVGYYDPQPSFLDVIGEDTPAYPSVEAMLSDTAPDLLFVGSPNEFHMDQIESGLAAGVRIFSEKPVVVSIEETLRLARLIGQHGADRLMVGLVLRYSQHMRDLRAALDDGVLGDIASLEANEHIAPYHGAFFMRDWRRLDRHAGGFMLEKCCHDLDLYNMITASRPSRLASFGGRRSFLPGNAPESNSENEIFHIKKSVWDSIDDPFSGEGDIVDYQTAIVEYESGASMAFHCNSNVPDEHRRFCIIGSHGMAEGDFLRGYLNITRRDGSRYASHDYGVDGAAKPGGHYGADHLMVADIVAHLRGQGDGLPVGVIDALVAGVTALKLDEARAAGQMLDLTETWAQFDAALAGKGAV